MNNEDEGNVYDLYEEQLKKQVTEATGLDDTNSNLTEGIREAMHRAVLYDEHDRFKEIEYYEKYGIESRMCKNNVCSDNNGGECKNDDRPVGCLYRMVDNPPNSLCYDEYMPSHREALDMLEYHGLLKGEREEYKKANSKYDKARSREERHSTEIKGIDFNMLIEVLYNVLSGEYYRAETDPMNDVPVEAHVQNICVEVEKAMGIYPNTRIY